jgi:hypothetical protein
MPFEKCPVCGGDLVEKEVEKVLRGGVYTAVLKGRAVRARVAVARLARVHACAGRRMGAREHVVRVARRGNVGCA